MASETADNRPCAGSTRDRKKSSLRSFAGDFRQLRVRARSPVFSMLFDLLFREKRFQEVATNFLQALDY